MEMITVSALAFKCPACGAHPNSPCNRIDGVVMPTPHSKRKELALGVSVSKHERIFSSLALLEANLANSVFPPNTSSAPRQKN
jgi:hypothetical protein